MKNPSSPSPAPFFHRFVPNWKANLIVFGALIAGVLAYFYWQVQQAHQTFRQHVQLNSRIIAGVIERNARNAVLAQEVVERIIQTFLGNTARFVDYLDGIEPFTADELSAFAAEAGLAGIRLTGADQRRTQGPRGWLNDRALSCSGSTPVLRHLADDHLFCLAWPRQKRAGCIQVGIDAVQIEKLQQQIGLEQLLKVMSRQGGITYVRLDDRVRQAPALPDDSDVRLIGTPNRKIAETRLALGSGQLVVGVDARAFFLRINRLWREFFAFSAVLAGLGVALSWVLFRLQQAHLNQVRTYERELGRQREDAALGRAAAAITHEIGNPLNAMSMGLQRLEMEADGLGDEHLKLIGTMRQAVDRTDRIISGIRRYARPLVPAHQPVVLVDLVSQIVALYQEPCRRRNIIVSVDAAFRGPISGDKLLLEEVMENLLKNSLEAQPDGGTIALTVDRQGTEAIVTVENGGLTLGADDFNRMAEPYFTTKTRGTGLGLSVARRIVEAHGGRMVFKQPAPGRLRIRIFLPIDRSEAGRG